MLLVYLAVGLIVLLVVIALIARGGRPRVQARRVTAEDTLRVMEGTVSMSGERVYTGLAGMIRNAQDKLALRRFACACAARAVNGSGMKDQTVLDALKIAQSLADRDTVPDGLERTRLAVSQIADGFDAHDTEDAPNPAAFVKARAASAVLACLGDDARTAAAEACCEAVTGADDVDPFTRIAKEMLR
jgi:hypothetical protein